MQCISPLDGRYAPKTEPLTEIFSEFGLISYRYEFEVKYFKFILKLLNPKLPNSTQNFPAFPPTLTLEEAKKIKILEKTTNHDVKSVELYIKSLLRNTPLEPYTNLVHFGLTSQDVNTTAYTMQLRKFTNDLYIPQIYFLLQTLDLICPPNIPMLSRTHGQPATPTTFKQQFKVYHTRLNNQFTQLTNYKYRTKLGGATGYLNAHKVAFPNLLLSWKPLLTTFLKEEFDITRLEDTTQISHYDDYSELFSIYIRINTILLDLCKDIWHYISINYFTQKPILTETGSSTMPHKINPIDFENAEGNLELSNTLLQHLQTKLPISRMQRDLTDSTTLRNLGTALGHSYISLQSLHRGFAKLEPNITYIIKDLNNHPEILAEAYQTVLRTLVPPLKTDPYELFKEFTRKESTLLSIESLHNFLHTIPDIPEKTLSYLLSLTPESYALLSADVLKEPLALKSTDPES